MGVILYLLLPSEEKQERQENYLRSALYALKIVSKNPQSILCGFIAALIFIPTTIFDMVWGVRFLQDGYGLDYETAVIRSAAVSLGWIIGCPLLGYISDKTGKRKPVLIGGSVVVLLCLIMVLFGKPGVMPPLSIALTIGIASGAGMIPYTIIKEANPQQYKGTATGLCNFITFTFSALMGQVFGWLLVRTSNGAGHFIMKHYQITFSPLIIGVGLAIVLTFFLKETGQSNHEKQ